MTAKVGLPAGENTSYRLIVDGADKEQASGGRIFIDNVESGFHAFALVEDSGKMPGVIAFILSPTWRSAFNALSEIPAIKPVASMISAISFTMQLLQR